MTTSRAATPNRRRKAISYRRFSNPSQIKGDSIRRQIQLSRDYAEAHNLDLDESLTYEDKGISAYHSKHREEGELGKLISAIKAGSIPEGSVILIESLDRLSRDTVDEAYDQFRKILKLGVSVVTLTDGKEYTSGSMSKDFGSLMISLVMMFRSHEESLMKSKRLKASWKAKRDQAQLKGGRKLTAICPGWLRLNKDENVYEVIPGRDEVVQRIFQMYIDGLGASVIANTLNEEGMEPWNRNAKSGWYAKTIQLTLKSIAVLGHYQPHVYVFNEKTRKRERKPEGEPIKNYFPPVITPDIFQKAMNVRKTRIVPQGRRGNTYSNLFTGMIVCSQCGSPLHSVNKGRGQQYLVCSAARRRRKNVCQDNYHWRYQEVEKAILDSISKVTFTQLFPDLFTDQRQVEIKLEKRLLTLEQQLETTTQELDNIQKLLIKRPENERLNAAFDEKEAEEIKLKQEYEAAVEALTQARTAQQSFNGDLEKAKAAIKRMKQIMAEGDDAEKYELRARLHTLLRNQISRLEFIPCPNSVPVKIWTPDHPQMTDHATGGYVDEEHNPLKEEDVWITEKESAGVIWAMFQAGGTGVFHKGHRIFVMRDKPYKHPTRSKKAYDNRFKNRPEDSRYISTF